MADKAPNFPKKPVPGLKRNDLLAHIMGRCAQLSKGRKPHINHYLSTGCTLIDLAISEGLGLPGGKVIEVVGREGSCKSALAMLVSKICQAMGGVVAWFDLETGFSDTLATEVVQCPIDPPTFNYVCPNYGDEALHLIETLCLEHHKSETASQTPLLIVVDSIPSIIGKAVATKYITHSTQKATGAKLLSEFFARPLKQKIQGSNIYIFLIHQVRSTLRTMTNADEEYTTPGGHAIPFYAHTRLDMRKEAVIWDDDNADRSDKIAQGILVRCTVTKAKHTTPYDSVVFPFYTRPNLPVRGLDDIRACLTYLSAKNALDRRGTWYYLEDEFKAQGLDNFWLGIVSCPEYCDMIRDLTRLTFLAERGIELDFSDSAPPPTTEAEDSPKKEVAKVKKASKKSRKK